MESNWRWNVYASGWQNSDIKLVARLLYGGFFNCCAYTQEEGFPKLALVGHADEQGYVSQWIPAGFQGFNPFPFLFATVPDHPAVPWV